MSCWYIFPTASSHTGSGENIAICFLDSLCSNSNSIRTVAWAVQTLLSATQGFLFFFMFSVSYLCGLSADLSLFMWGTIHVFYNVLYKIMWDYGGLFLWLIVLKLQLFLENYLLCVDWRFHSCIQDLINIFFFFFFFTGSPSTLRTVLF